MALEVSRRSVLARRSARSRRSSPAARRALRRCSRSIVSALWRRSNWRRPPARRPIVPRRLVTRRSRAFSTRRRASSPFTVSSLLTTRLVEPGRSPADRCVRSARPAKPPKCVCAARRVPAAWASARRLRGEQLPMGRRCFGGDDPYQPVVSADTGVPHREPGRAIVSLSLRPADPRGSLTRTR
jgi:hypothetical protein